jgi:hypothetical protein
MPYKDPEKARVYHREHARAWRSKNPEGPRKASRKWRANNPDKTSASHREWCAKNSERVAYLRHKGTAKRRRIPFLLTFEEWAAIWQASCKWEQRGFNDPEKYCMARTGDQGPYAVGNVRICTNAENFAENDAKRRGGTRSEQSRARMSEAAQRRWARHRATKGL